MDDLHSRLPDTTAHMEMRYQWLILKLCHPGTSAAIVGRRCSSQSTSGETLMAKEAVDLRRRLSHRVVINSLIGVESGRREVVSAKHPALPGHVNREEGSLKARCGRRLKRPALMFGGGAEGVKGGGLKTTHFLLSLMHPRSHSKTAHSTTSAAPRTSLYWM